MKMAQSVYTKASFSLKEFSEKLGLPEDCCVLIVRLNFWDRSVEITMSER